MRSILTLIALVALGLLAIPQNANADLVCVKKSVKARPNGRVPLKNLIVRTTEATCPKRYVEFSKDTLVEPDDLADTAKPSGADYENTVAVVGPPAPVPSADTVMASATITAPASGIVVVYASGYFFNASDATGRCAITTEDTINPDEHLIVGEVDADSSYDSFGAVRTFEVTAGEQTFNLVCESTIDTITVRYPNIAAVYVPQQY